MSDEQRRFQEDYEIWQDLPDVQRIAIGEIFHNLIADVLALLRPHTKPEYPPSPERPAPAPRRKGP